MMNNKFPCFKVRQNDEIFYITRMPIEFLSRTVNFHFRAPFAEESKDMLDSKEYILALERRYGITVEHEEKGIQRRTDIRRIHDIADFVEESSGIVFPTPIVLAFNVFGDCTFNEQCNISEHCIEFSDDVQFTIIDGQHRLAGLVAAMNSLKGIFEMPVTLIMNADLSIATQLFIDINGNQRKVSKSVIYDLYENISKNETDEIFGYASIVRALNDREHSPLHRMIKRLGSGEGTVSQSFLVEYIQDAYNELDKKGLVQNTKNMNTQEIYSELYSYFTFIKEAFSNLWKNTGNSKNNSQLVKTNGVGALLIAYPNIWEKIQGSPSEKKNEYRLFFESRKEFNWDDKEKYSGTGKKVQRQMAKDLFSLCN